MIVLLTALLLQVPAQAPAKSPAMQVHEEGQAAFAKQENAAALAAFDRAIALDPKNADFHHARCRTLPRLQRHAEGIESCTTALQLRPDSAPILIDRGHYYINIRQLEPALADLQRVEATKLEDYGLYYHLALSLYLKGDFAKAADAYVACGRTAATPENLTACKAWQFLALTRAGRKDEAKALLDGFNPEPGAPVDAYTDRLLLFKGVKTEQEVAARNGEGCAAAGHRRLRRRRVALAQRPRAAGARVLHQGAHTPRAAHRLRRRRELFRAGTDEEMKDHQRCPR